MKLPFVPKALFAAVLTNIMTSGAFANEMAISDLPGKGDITISGTVQDIASEREFTLRDESGKIDVSIESNKSAVIAKGDKVTVSGKMESSMLGKYIAASDVQVHKGLTTALSDAIEGNTSLSLENAKKTKIAQLPKEGLVKIAGKVTDVSDEKNFTLKDATGKIDVIITSDENVVLTENAAVTVIGYVDDGLLSKSIQAKHVIVTADAGTLSPASGSSTKKDGEKTMK